MNMRNRKLQSWLGRLMVTAMLFSPTALLWAQSVAHQPAQPQMHLSCHEQAGMAGDSAPQHSHCQHNHACSSQCLSSCVYASANLLPSTAIGVLPFFQISSTHFTLSLTPDGNHSTVLERPPRNLS